jgi:FtsP/CotA-like multicopper oxidase with cupredoxin domain
VLAGTPSQAASQAAQPPAATVESFAYATTASGAWRTDVACLTAGSALRSDSGIAACNGRAPADPAGEGALELTTAAANEGSFAVLSQPVQTAGGIEVTFTPYSFGASSPGAGGMTLFFADGTQAAPQTRGALSGSLGYAGAPSARGLAHGYLAVALDEAGLFSSPANGRAGGPGIIPQTIAVRGSASSGYAYLGGFERSGRPASLPFSLGSASPSRPRLAPAFRVRLTAAGRLTIAADRHDGNGFVELLARSIAGRGGQGPVPRSLYVGFTAANGSAFARHQVGAVAIAPLAAAAAAPAPSTRAAAAAATELANPPQIVSSGGTLTFNVSAQLSGSGTPEFVYNGSNVPPTLRLNPGDTLIVNYTNNLPAPPNGAGYTNATNLHYHGLHVSPANGSDDEIDMLAQPGQTLHYTIAIPSTHPPGLYWYHTHAHGETERQTLSGMSGAIVIEGISQYAPATAAAAERIIVMRDTLTPGELLPNADPLQINAMRWAKSHAAYGASGTQVRGKSTKQTQNPYVVVDPLYRRISQPVTASAHCRGPETPFRDWTVNGLTQPAIGIKPGETQFWRMVNAGADTYLDVQVDNTVMQIVAIDGVPVSNGVNTPPTLTVGHWLLPPASRVEFLVTGPAGGAPLSLRTNCVDSGPSGAAMPAAVLATLDPTTSVPGAAVHGRHVTSLRSARSTWARARAIKAAAQSSGTLIQQTVTYSDQNTINGVAYNPGGPPLFYAQSGTVQEWTVVNNSQQIHTFHIHQIHFVVEAINGVTQAQQYVMDNVNIPAATVNGPGTVKLLLDFTDPIIVGTFLVHCHILAHEDAGMMAQIRVGTAPPLTLNASNVSFYSPTAPSQSLAVTGGTAPYSVTGCTGVATATVNGNSVSISPAGAGGCLLIVSDSGGLTATVPISVQGLTSPIKLVPNIAGFASATSLAQTITISGGTLPYSASGCNGIASAKIAAGTLTVSPIAVGACSLIINDSANNQQTLSVSVNGASSANPQDNVTFHQNAMRTGWYSAETTLTAANVASSNFGLIKTLTAPAGSPAFGKVYAQPLFASNETLPDGSKHNLVIIATATDQVYAFDDQTFNVIWHRSFTNPPSVVQQNYSSTGCTDVNPDIGIVGTPTIDRALDRMYVAVPTNESGTFYIRLHAISLKTGLEAVDANNNQIGPQVITGTATLATGGTVSLNPEYNFQRPALLEANGNIYVGLGSHCDFNAGATHGWLLAYNAASLAPAGNAIITDANDGTSYFLGAPWMSGFGPAADSQGNVYFVTGNGPWNGKTNFSMSALKVPGTLNLAGASYFTPASEASDSASDADLGSGGILLFPDQTQGSAPHLAITGGKTGYKWLLNRDNLGGQQPADAGALWTQNTGGGIWGGPAYFADAAGNQYIVYGTISTYKLNYSPYSLSVVSSANVGCLECRDAGSQPIVSSNGTTAGTAVVWALKTAGNSGGPISLYAFDALKMTVLFNGTAGQWTIGSGAGNIGGALVSPVVANGRVYVPTDGSVAVFGLK